MYVPIVGAITGVVAGRGSIMRVLLVEDDQILGAAVQDHVIADGHSVDWVQRLDEAREHVKLAVYDLGLLDLMLPDGRGISFLRA